MEDINDDIWLFSTVTEIFPDYDFASKHDSTSLHAGNSTCY